MRIYLAHNNNNSEILRVFLNALQFRFGEILIGDFSVPVKSSAIGAIVDFYQQATKEIAFADVVICECSEGYEHLHPTLRLATQSDCPVIIVKNEKNKSDIKLIENYRKSNVYRCSYNLDRFDNFIEQVRSKEKALLNKKYILVINSEIARYLDWKSDSARMHKAEIVRRSIRLAMKADKDYRLFAKQF